MKLQEITRLSFQFHRAVYVSLTEKCPISCRHCFVESGPRRTEQAELSAFRTWMDGIVAEEGVEVIFFSGGEPYSHPRALRYGLRAALDAGRYSVVCSSGFWAKTERGAGRLLDSYPRMGCLLLSTDVFHEEFVPLGWLRHAAAAAIARGIDVAFQIVDEDQRDTDFMRRFEREVGFDLVPPEQVFFAPLERIGRAAEEVGPPLVQITRAGDGFSRVPDAPCPWLGTPWLREDGVLCACPNTEVFRKPAHPLHLGDLGAEDFGAVSARVNQDPYVQTLRVLGPRAVVEQFPVREWGWDESSFGGESMCDLCHSLAAVPGLPARLREAAGTEGFMSRLDTMRLLLYTELPRAGRVSAAVSEA